MDETTREALTRALAGASDWHDVGSALRTTADEQADERLGAHRAAFDYVLQVKELARERDDSQPFAPRFAFEGGTYPMPLDRMPGEVLEEWASALEVIDHPLLRSRYGDLLWCRRFGERPDGLARSALDGYEALARDGSDEYLTRTQSILRGLELALSIGDRARAAVLGSIALTAAVTALESEPDKPGIYLTLLEGLAHAPADVRPAEVLEVARRAEAVCSDKGYVADAAGDLLVQLLPDEESRGAVRRRQVARWREADAQDGLTRFTNLRRALELATTYGLRDEAALIRRELQAIKVDELGLKPIGTTVEVPREQTDPLIEALVGDDDFASGLRRIGSYGPPSGDPDRHAALANELRQATPLLFRATHHVIGPEGATVRELASEDEKLREQISRQESYSSMLTAAAIIAPALERAAAKYGVPDAAAIATGLRSQLIDEPTSLAMGEAIRRHLLGEHDAAAHQLVPRIEKVVRALARAVGVIVVAEPRGDRPGGVQPIGGIVAELAGTLDEPWRRYLRNLLCDELGLNLRNRIAHGLVEVVTPQESALLVHAAAFLSLLEIGPRDGPTE